MFLWHTVGFLHKILTTTSRWYAACSAAIELSQAWFSPLIMAYLYFHIFSMTLNTYIYVHGRKTYEQIKILLSNRTHSVCLHLSDSVDPHNLI